MTKTVSFFLRVTGIIFFMATLSVAMPVFFRNVDSFAFFIASPELGWGLFYIFTAVLFVSFLLFSLFSTGTAAIFAGGAGYTQSVWNCGIYSLFFLGLFTSILLLTGVSHEEEDLLLVCEIGMLLLLVYNALILVLLKKEEGFYWKNLLSFDSNTRLCLKVFAVMLVVVEAAAFLYAHKFVE